MLDRTNERSDQPPQPPQRSRAPADFQEHLARLEAAGAILVGALSEKVGRKPTFLAVGMCALVLLPMCYLGLAKATELHERYRADYAAYWSRHATPDSPAMRGADPAIVLVPGVGMFSFGANRQTARVAGEFYVNAINVMRGAEALSTYSPISDAEKFRIEYWALEEAKLQRMPKPASHAGRIALGLLGEVDRTVVAVDREEGRG